MVEAGGTLSLSWLEAGAGVPCPSPGQGGVMGQVVPYHDPAWDYGWGGMEQG